MDWMLFRAFSKDNEGGANVALAVQHYQMFVEQLGLNSAPMPQSASYCAVSIWEER